MINMDHQQPIAAGFWVRAWADFIDSLLLDIASIIMELIALVLIFGFQIRFIDFFQILGTFNLATFLENFNPIFLQLGLILSRGVISFVYFSWFTYKFQTTIGKRCFNVYVVSSSGDVQGLTLQQSVVRYLSYGLSYLLGGVGFMMVVFHPEKRALHDLISRTRCVIKVR